MRLFVDERQPDKIITEQELAVEYLLDEDIEPEITFHMHIANCMSYNGGTLTEVCYEGCV